LGIRVLDSELQLAKEALLPGRRGLTRYGDLRSILVLGVVLVGLVVLVVIEFLALSVVLLVITSNRVVLNILILLLRLS